MNPQTAGVLLSATSYPLLYQEQAARKGRKLRPLLMVFPVGSHWVDGVQYKADELIDDSLEIFWSSLHLLGLKR